MKIKVNQNYDDSITIMVSSDINKDIVEPSVKDLIVEKSVEKPKKKAKSTKKCDLKPRIHNNYGYAKMVDEQTPSKKESSDGNTVVKHKGWTYSFDKKSGVHRINHEGKHSSTNILFKGSDLSFVRDMLETMGLFLE